MNTTRPGRPPSICFVSPNAYPVLTGRPDLGQLGGAEVQQVLVARELCRRGVRVIFITHDGGQPEGIVHEGIAVTKMCAAAGGWPILRFFHPRWSSLCRAMARAAADVYYQRTAGVETGQCALWCRWRGRPFVYAVASDSDCDPASPYLSTSRDRWLFHYGIRHATRVVVQTAAQERAICRAFGAVTRRISSCAVDPGEPPSFAARDSRRVLWIGRIAPKKRFEWLLELAALSPEYEFDVVGDDQNKSDYAVPLLARARGMSNMRLHGQIAPPALGAYYDRALTLVCTSRVEGFPNSFVEAWARGVPTLTTFDPDGVTAAHRVGLVADSPAELRRGLESLAGSPDLWKDCAIRARRHYVDHHRVEGAADAYTAMLEELIHRTAGCGASPERAADANVSIAAASGRKSP